MARSNISPYGRGQTQRPAGINITRADIEAGLKSIKMKAPNRKFSSQAYKSGLPKVEGSSGGIG